MMSTLIRICLASTCLLWAALPGAAAASDADTIAALRAQIDALSQRLEALEAAQKPTVPVETLRQPESVVPSAAAEPRLRFKGNFRYRMESIDAEFAAKDRHRNRIRIRPAVIAQVADSVEVGIGLATGGDSPVSSNQTLGGAFSKKAINLDLAYVDWSTPVDGLSLIAGKYQNPLHRAGGNGLLWDSDLRPEGASLSYRTGAFTLTGLLNWVTESSGSDQLVGGGQFSWHGEMGEWGKLRLGAGYYDFGSIKGEPVPFDGNPRGNSVDVANRYLNDYEELELFAEYGFQLGERPTSVFFNYVENLAADRFETGWALGGTMKFRHGNRPWQIGYTYQDLEADAVFALFTDSDFIGGGTDGKGHILKGKYALTERISLGGTLLINERGENQTGIPEDYNRLMLDVEFKY